MGKKALRFVDVYKRQTVYRLKLPASYNMHPVINIEHLRKYERSARFADHTLLPDMRVTPHEEEYEVEKIIGVRFNKSRRRREFLVRWKGYGPEHDTFEPERNLRNAFLKFCLLYTSRCV